MTSTVIGLALASLRGDQEGFNAVRSQASQEPGFVPAVFATINALATRIGKHEGKTAQEMLEQTTTLTWMGESGLFDDDEP